MIPAFFVSKIKSKGERNGKSDRTTAENISVKSESELLGKVCKNGRVTSKAWLIGFLCDNAMEIVKKNDWHIKMLMSAGLE